MANLAQMISFHFHSSLFSSSPIHGSAPLPFPGVPPSSLQFSGRIAPIPQNSATVATTSATSHLFSVTGKPSLHCKRSRIAISLPKAAPSSSNNSPEQKWVSEGSVTESLSNGMFRVLLDNQDLILGYASGKIRQAFIRILPGDRVRVEISRYDSTKGRITYRLRNNSKGAKS